MAILCPKSVRACAIRLTRMNDSGVPLDPLTPNSRIQTAAFAELNLSPDADGGTEHVTRTPSGNSVAIIDRENEVIKGMKLDLKLCGVPTTVLEMLTGMNPLLDGADTVGGAMRDTKGEECVNLVMLELWSRNVGAKCGPDGLSDPNPWIHWLLPKTLQWSLSSGLSFSNGPLEVSLSGYAEQNAAWFPSFPGETFPSYAPGGGDPLGWPTGAAGPTLPTGIAADPWSLDDQITIRASGALTWRAVNALPSPLADCEYTPSELVG